jgi:large subunit ribosomal protein L7/L12
LTALELSELASYLEKKFGVSGMPMVAAAGTAPASAEATAGKAGKEEKTIFTVNLINAGTNKLAVIKVVREILPNLGLMDAKKLVESAPKELLKDVKKEAAEEAKKKIEAAGGKVELK